MAAFPRALCVIVTLWMVCSRSPATIQAGSPDPAARYIPKEFAAIRETAQTLRARGDLPGLESLYQNASALASREKNLPEVLRQRINLGNVHLLQLRYPEAISDYLAARQLAQDLNDSEYLGLISLNLCSLYLQVWDMDAALAAAEQGRAATARAGHTLHRALFALILARFYSISGDPRAESLYYAGIEAARTEADTSLEAQGWQFLGDHRLQHGDLARADQALVEAFRLRVLYHPADLRHSYYFLGALRLAQALQGDNLRNELGPAPKPHLLAEAKLLTERALATTTDVKGVWLFLHQLGRIQEAQGQMEEALKSFGAAIDQAALWWRTLPVADSSLTGANAALQHQAFDSFIEAAARQALHASDQRLMAESFMAQEFNRASSLRETRALAPIWRAKLSPEYWETLSRLRVQDALLLRNSGDRAEAERLRLRISEMESIAGVGFSLSNNENFRSLNSLSHFQEGLKQSELLLSFHLGPSESYLWAVTDKSLRLYRLDADDRIRQRVKRFTEAVQNGRAQVGDSQRFGSELYQCLFGQLTADEAGHPQWLVAAEGPLFDVPFAALVVGNGAAPKPTAGFNVVRDGTESEYLVQRNSVQMIPGALLLRGAPARASSRAPAGASSQSAAGGSPQLRMVAVGDPIYNDADARRPSRWLHPLRWPPSKPGVAGQLNRLIASGREVEASSLAWSSSSWNSSSLILTGVAAGRPQFLAALDPAPSVIHLATHVLSNPQRPDQAFVAFSMDFTGQPQLLATSDIAKLQVPGALVIMSGCSTATGEPLSGAGLLGLTRAWLMAGASATIATKWPVQDTTSEDSATDFLPAFYRHWKTSSTAEALRQAQLDMLRAGGWRAAPSYWAAYQLTGGER